MAKITTATFHKELLAPKYWFLWLAVGLFKLILCLPYPVLLQIGKGLGWIFARLSFGKKRTHIARQNLKQCFPHFSESEIEQILKQNIQATGLAIIETGMAWFWSDKRIKKWSKVEGLHHLKEQAQQGIILVGVHFLTLELGARIIGIHHPGIGVYRPHDNPFMDWLQLRGRLRSNKAMLDRKDLRGILQAIRKGDMVWYAPDHDYGAKNSIFVPFFAVNEAATTLGSYYLLKSAPHASVIAFAPLRNPRYSGYTISISPPEDFSQCSSKEAICHKMNQVVEQEILKDITQYMWLHRRFKTRPEGAEQFYPND